MRKTILIVLFLLSFLSPRCAQDDVSFASEELSVRLPVIMYHSVLNSRKGRYIVSEGALDRDIASLKEAGYTAVTPEEVALYISGKGFLPEKPVMITFDDGHYNNMYYAVPILEKYGFCAVFNIVGAYSEYSTSSGDDSNPNYSHITWGQMAELAKGNVVRFGNHSYNMHKMKPRYGIAQRYGESDADYVSALIKDTERLQEKLYEACGYRPIVYAYPFGKYSNLAADTLRGLGFKLLLTCNEGVTEITFNSAEKEVTLKRVNREGNYATGDLLAKIAPKK